MNAPLVPITLGFLFGVLGGAYLTCPAPALIAASVTGAALAIRWRAHARAGSAALVITWALFGMLRVAMWQAHPDHGLIQFLPEEPRPIQLHGIVLEDPVQPFDPEEVGRQTCVMDLRHVRTEELWRPIRGRVRVTFQALPQPVWGQTPQGRQLDRTGSDPKLSYGDEVLVQGLWSRVPAPGNPGQYDWRAALARQRIGGLLQVKPYHGVVVLRHDQGSRWMAAVFRLRRRWERLIHETFNAHDAGLLRSLLLGQRVALDERLKEAFVNTGTIHLLVISGFNVGLVAWLLECFLRVIGVPWHLRLIVVAVALGGYCALTGLQPPVLRATLMAWVVLGALALDRVVSWPNTLAAAALFILWVAPTQLFDPGFQLSFGAVMSLLVFTSRWHAWLDRRLGWLSPRWLRRFLAVSLSTTSAIWVGLSPVLAWYFHLVSPVSMLANLLLVPLVSLLVSLGTALLMVGTLFEAAVSWTAVVLKLLLWAVVRCVFWCHALPGGYWFVGSVSPVFLAGYYGLLVISLLRRRFGLDPGRLLICWMAGIVLWAWSLVGARALDSRWLRVDVLEVGHGDSLLVRTPVGATLLVDAGSRDAGRWRVVPFLRHEGISSLDALVLTHTDEDHLGGALPLLQELGVRRLLTNGVRDDTMSARRLRRLAADQRVQEQVLAAGLRVEVDPSVTIEVLHPPCGLVPGVAPESNDNSIVLKLTKGRVSVLLTGDIEEAGLPWLLATGRVQGTTALKVPHHGSRLGEAGGAFFEAAQPAIAILSVGRVHRLPAAETVRLLEQTGAVLYSTRDDGMISLRTDGTRVDVRTFRHH